MKKLYLHMGFAKTATSSFQLTCKQYVHQLYDQSYIFPLFSSVNLQVEQSENHCHPINSLFCDKPQAHYSNILRKVESVESLNQEFYEQFNSLLQEDKDIILSAESIPFLAENQLERMKNFIEDYGFEIIPIAFVRSPYSYYCSQKQQLIIIGLSEENEYIDTCLSTCLKRLIKVFPQSKFISFGSACKHIDGPVGLLFEMIGVNYSSFHMLHTNAGRSNTLTRLQHELYKMEPHIIEANVNPRYQRIPIFSYDAEFKAKYLLTKEEYAKVEAYIEKENEFIQNFLGEEFTDKEIKFSEADDSIKDLASFLVGHFPNSGDIRLLDAVHDALQKTDTVLASRLLRLINKIKPKK